MHFASHTCRRGTLISRILSVGGFFLFGQNEYLIKNKNLVEHLQNRDLDPAYDDHALNNTLLCTAIHCNTPQQNRAIATQCNTLQRHSTTQCNTLQRHSTTHSNALQYTALQHTATRRKRTGPLQHTDYIYKYICICYLNPCIYTHIYAYMNTFIGPQLSQRAYKCVYICIYIYKHVRVYSYIHKYIYTYIHIYIYTHIYRAVTWTTCLYICEYIHVYIYTYIHRFMYT